MVRLSEVEPPSFFSDSEESAVASQPRLSSKNRASRMGEALKKRGTFRTRYGTKSVTVPQVFSHDCLRKNPFFASRSDSFLEQISELLRVEVYHAGDVIMDEGSFGDQMYFLHSGSVEVLVKNRSEKVATLLDGSIFGEMAMFMHGAGHQRTATVRALEFCDCRVIQHKAFSRVLSSFPADRRFFEKLSQERHEALRQASEESPESCQKGDRTSLYWHATRKRATAEATLAGSRMSTADSAHRRLLAEMRRTAAAAAAAKAEQREEEEEEEEDEEETHDEEEEEEGEAGEKAEPGSEQSRRALTGPAPRLEEASDLPPSSQRKPVACVSGQGCLDRLSFKPGLESGSAPPSARRSARAPAPPTPQGPAPGLPPLLVGRHGERTPQQRREAVPPSIPPPIARLCDLSPERREAEIMAEKLGERSEEGEEAPAGPAQKFLSEGTQAKACRPILEILTRRPPRACPKKSSRRARPGAGCEDFPDSLLPALARSRTTGFDSSASHRLADRVSAYAG